MKHQKLLKVLLVVFLLSSLVLAPLNELNRADAQDDSGQPAHYIVMKGQPDGKYEIVHYQEVRLRSKLIPLDDALIRHSLATSPRHKDLMVAALQTADGTTVYQGIVDTSPWLRSEVVNQTDPMEIDAKIFRSEEVVFVVRVPKIEGTRLVLKKDLDTQIQTFDLDQVVKTAPRIETNLDSKLVVTGTYGDPSNRVDLLVMGDGYTAAEESAFNAQLANLRNGFYGVSPLSEYQNYFNTVGLFTVSEESGADHPPYMPPEECPGYDNSTCCVDPAMQKDPLNGKMRNTAFNGRYCGWRTHRVVVVDNEILLAEAGERYPDWDSIIVMVNDSTYGGAAFQGIAAICNCPQAPRIALHEFGHSFADLADEYTSAYPGYPGCSDLGGNPCEANVTDVTNRANIKWLPWILPDTPIPTPETNAYYYTVGLFEGARYFPSGMFRSGHTCLMQSLGSGVTFCSVPTQAMVLKFYQGWHSEKPGISMLEPGTQSPVGRVELTHPDSVELKSDILSPQGGPQPLIEWYVDGVKVSGAHAGSFIYETDYDKPGSHLIKLRVKDVTPLVKDLMSGGSTVFEHRWVVNVTVNPVEEEFFQYFPAVHK